MTELERDLLDELTMELMILRSAWLLAGDDDRRRKALFVGPKSVRVWSRLIARAGKSLRASPQDGER